jgi:hypothetical protein
MCVKIRKDAQGVLGLKANFDEKEDTNTGFFW